MTNMGFGRIFMVGDVVKDALRARIMGGGTVVPLRKPKESAAEVVTGKVVRVRQASDTEANMDMFGVVGGDWFGDGITQDDVARELKGLSAKTKKINLRLSSPGGDAFEGRAIANMLREHYAKVYVNIISEASSAASIIAMAGDYIRMSEGALMLIHRCYTFALGNCDEMRDLARDLELVDDQAVETYQRKTKMSAEDILSLMKENRYMGAKEAKNLGFVDEIDSNVDQLSVVKIAAFDRSKLKLPALPTPDGGSRARAQSAVDRIRAVMRG